MAKRAGLARGAFGAADEVLGLPLNPEMRWVVGEICQDRYKGDSGKGAPQAFAHSTVEVGDERNHKIRLLGEPELFEEAHRRRMIQADDTVHEAQKLRGTERPTFAEHEIVE